MTDPSGAYGFPSAPYVMPQDDPEYSTVIPFDSVACTIIQEETLTCPGCGQFTLCRDHFIVKYDTGEDEEFGYADRCWTCEPFESHMPRIVAGQAMRARSVV